MINTNELQKHTTVILHVHAPVNLSGGKKNEHQGRITKKHSIKVDLCTPGMYEERMRENDPSFSVSPRKWGIQRDNSCIVDHNDVEYIACFVNERLTETSYFLDNKPIKKEDITGLKSSSLGEVQYMTISANNIERFEVVR